MSAGRPRKPLKHGYVANRDRLIIEYHLGGGQLNKVDKFEKLELRYTLR